MIRLLLVAIIGLALYYGYRRIQTLPLEQRAGLWWKLGLGAMVIICLLAVASGRMHWLGGLIALLLAGAKFGARALFRLWPLLRATGKDAIFRTEHLEVRFVMKTSQLQGTVLKGAYEGERLETMPAERLRELAEHYQEKDRKSCYLVRVFLQRTNATGNGQSQQHQATFSGNPSREEALLILGLSGTPGNKEIIAAHRRLIQKLHPDRGGNDYLAARINQAKETLLQND